MRAISNFPLHRHEASMPSKVPASLLEFFFPSNAESLAVAPRGDALDAMSKPLSNAELYDAAEAAISERFMLSREDRKIAKMLYEKLDSAEFHEVAEQHRREFHDRPSRGKPSPERPDDQLLGAEAPKPRVGHASGQPPSAPSLHALAIEGSAMDIAELASDGFDLDSVDGRGWTPAHAASAANNFEALEELLLRGVDPHARTPEGATPLMLAVAAMSTRCIEILMPVSALGAKDLLGNSAQDYVPDFHTDEDDPGYEEKLRFVALLQSLGEASKLDQAAREVVPRGVPKSL